MSTPESQPTRLLRPEVLSGLSTLDLVARVVVEGFLIGMHRSPSFGFSQEFAEYRQYVEGDDLRYIDWNVYARSERTYIKRFLGETNSHLVLLLDASASMGYGTAAVTKFQYGQYLAACLAYLASRQHDAIGCIIFDEEVRDYRPPTTRSGNLFSVLHTIDNARPAHGTNLEKPFRQFAGMTSHRGMVVVISDFYCDAEQMIENHLKLQKVLFYNLYQLLMVKSHLPLSRVRSSVHVKAALMLLSMTQQVACTLMIP
jgi:uncharacterized protein (DUF58 family)